MVVIGVDLHKRTHTAVAADATGRKLAEKTVGRHGRGPPRARPLGRPLPEPRTFALEDCRHLSRRLSDDLLRRRRGRRPGPDPS